MHSAADPTPERPATRQTLLDARLTGATKIDRVEIREIRILAGQAAGAHVHNCPVVGNIVDGSVIYQVGDEPPTRLTAGDVFYEPEGKTITRFDATEEGVRFLGYFLLAADQEPSISMP